MAEENTTNNAQPANEEAAQQPSFQLVRCYLKDASLEMPHAPEIFLTAPAEQPNVDIQFEVSQRRLPMEGAWAFLWLMSSVAERLSTSGPQRRLAT